MRAESFPLWRLFLPGSKTYFPVRDTVQTTTALPPPVPEKTFSCKGLPYKPTTVILTPARTSPGYVPSATASYPNLLPNGGG